MGESRPAEDVNEKRADVPSGDTRVETMARVLASAYFEWLEKQPRKT